MIGLAHFCTICCVPSSFLRKKRKTTNFLILNVVEMWFLEDSWFSKISPRFLAVLVGIVVSDPNWIEKIVLYCCTGWEDKVLSSLDLVMSLNT